MITVEENDLIEANDVSTLSEEEMKEKIQSVKESFERGEVPEDLKNFIESLNEEEPDDIEEDEVDESEILEDTSSYSGNNDSEEYLINLDDNVSADDLNDIF